MSLINHFNDFPLRYRFNEGHIEAAKAQLGNVSLETVRYQDPVPSGEGRIVLNLGAEPLTLFIYYEHKLPLFNLSTHGVHSLMCLEGEKARIPLSEVIIQGVGRLVERAFLNHLDDFADRLFSGVFEYGDMFVCVQSISEHVAKLEIGGLKAVFAYKIDDASSPFHLRVAGPKGIAKFTASDVNTLITGCRKFFRDYRMSRR